jgi:hypothetical protein
MRAATTILLLLLTAPAPPLAGQIVRSREIATPLRESATPLRTQLYTAAVLTASAMGSTPTSVTMQWSGVSGAAEYRIFHGPSGSGPWMFIARVPGSVTQLEDRGLVPGTAFQYRITAFSDTSGQTQLAEILGSGTTAAVAPFSVAASCSPSGTINGEPVQNCTWSWQPVPLAEAYRVHRVYDNSFLGTLAKCWTDESTYDVAQPQYARNDVGNRTATCQHHFAFAALYRMQDFPAPGQVLTVEGPRATWWPQ